MLSVEHGMMSDFLENFKKLFWAQSVLVCSLSQAVVCGVDLKDKPFLKRVAIVTGVTLKQFIKVRPVKDVQTEVFSIVESSHTKSFP